MWQWVKEVLFKDPQLVYVSLGMVFSCVIQFYIARGKRVGWLERAGSSFICALFSAALTLPLLDYFPELPPSISLLIGSFCGSMGDKGLRQIMRAVVDRALGIPNDYTPRAPQPNFPREMTRRYNYETPSDEPPMPTDKRGGKDADQNDSL